MKVRWITIFSLLLGVLMTLKHQKDGSLQFTQGFIERISVSSEGSQGNALSWYPSISGDGRFVAFYSNANNLVPDDTNEETDVFVYDRQTRETIRVSISSEGVESNDLSSQPAISLNGRYVGFSSYASNLVEGDTNGEKDVFVYDLHTAKIVRVSVASDGTQADAGAAFGTPVFSTDGRYVAFSSWATNLVAGDTNGFSDIFVHDQETQEITRVSVSSNGSEGNGMSFKIAISAEGRWVAFTSSASNLVEGDDNYFCDTNFDGEYTDNCWDVFVHDRETGITMLVSATGDGSVGNNWSEAPTMSGDGRFIAFDSVASDLMLGDNNFYCDLNFNGVFDENCPDVFVLDQETGVLKLVSMAPNGAYGNRTSQNPAFSADGHFIAFDSSANNLVEGDINGMVDVFIYGMLTGKNEQVSIAWNGVLGNWGSYRPSLSENARFVAFDSQATNLVQGGGDTNDMPDVFVRDLAPHLLFLPIVSSDLFP